MKFVQYVKVDKIKQRIDEDEIKNKKPKRIKECCGDDVDDDDFEEQTRILHTVMNITKNLLSSKCLVIKTKCLLDIIYLMSSYMEDSCEEDDGEKNGGMVFEKKEST